MWNGYRKGRGFISIPKDPACAGAGPSKHRNILSTGSFPLPSSSTRASVQSSPRNETFLRSEQESGMAGADYAATEPGSGSPCVLPAHTSNRVSLSLDTYKLSASNFHPKVKPKHMYNWAPAKPSSICQ